MLGLAAVPAFAAPAQDGDNSPILGGNLLDTQVVEGRAWTLEGRFGTIYDTNFRRTVDPVAAVRLSPLLHFGLGLPVGRQQLFFGADVGRDIVVNQPGFNRGRYAVGGGIEWRLGTRCSGMIGAEAYQRLTIVSEQATLTNNVQSVEAFAGSLGCRSATGFGFGGSVDHRTYRNDTPVRAPYDLRSMVFAPNISYGTQTIGTFSLTTTFNSTTYPNRATPTPDGFVEEGIKIFNGRLGYSRTFGTRLQLDVGISRLKTTPRPDTVLTIINGQVVPVSRQSFSGAGFDASLTYQPSPRMGLNLVATRNVTVSPNVGAQFIVRNAYGADFTYSLGPSIDLGLGGRILKNQYERSFTTASEIARNHDNTKRLYVSLDYSPVPLYSIGVELAHQWRRADPVLFDFNSTTARLNLRVKLGRG